MSKEELTVELMVPCGSQLVTRKRVTEKKESDRIER